MIDQKHHDDGEKIFSYDEAMEISFKIAVVVAKDILNKNYHLDCPGCPVCAVIKFVMPELDHTKNDVGAEKLS